VYVAAEGDAQLLGVTRQIIGEPGFEPTAFSSGSIGPWPVSAAVLATLTRLGSVLSEQFELAGLFGVDFMSMASRFGRLRLIRAIRRGGELWSGVRVLARSRRHVAACGGFLVRLSEPRRRASGRGEDGPARSESKCHGKATLFATRDSKSRKRSPIIRLPNRFGQLGDGG